MDVSVFLAKLIGLFLLAMGLLWISRGHVILPLVEEFDANRPAVFLGGLFALVVGLAMAIGHNVWEFSWRGLVTLAGYASLLKGVSVLAFPDWPRATTEWMRKEWAARLWLFGVLVLGGYLTWAGFSSR